VHASSDSQGMEQSTSSSGGQSSPMARKRVIYAHSDILTRRSEYFATLLSSAFRESAGVLDRERGRTMHTIVVEEADFVSLFWLLKYLYCDWLLFREDDDPRAAVDGIGAGWSARWLSQGSEWEWKTFSGTTGQFEDPADEDSAAKSVTSDSVSAGSIISDGSRNGKAIGLTPPIPPTSNRTPSRTSASSSLRPTTGHTAATRRPGKLPLVTTNIPTATATVRSPSSSRSSPPQPQQHSHFYPLSPSQGRVQTGRPPPDPHEHPTPTPTAASALSVYQLAHRYRIPGLQQLALEHMMSSLSARGAFPLLLATCFWAELNGMVQVLCLYNQSELFLLI
jgi:BTB/POZ domain